MPEWVIPSQAQVRTHHSHEENEKHRRILRRDTNWLGSTASPARRGNGGRQIPRKARTQSDETMVVGLAGCGGFVIQAALVRKRSVEPLPGSCPSPPSTCD